MAEVWIVQGDCGDYYCDRDHVLAIAHSETEAILLREAALELATTYIRRDGRTETLKRYPDVTIEGPIEIGALREENSVVDQTELRSRGIGDLLPPVIVVHEVEPASFMLPPATLLEDTEPSDG